MAITEGMGITRDKVFRRINPVQWSNALLREEKISQTLRTEREEGKAWEWGAQGCKKGLRTSRRGGI